MESIRTIDEAGLQRLVDAFYARIRTEAELGPIFNAAIDDWPRHLDKLAAFWSSVMLGTGRYKGQPVPAHLKHRHSITPALFARWLALWKQTADEIMPPEAASALQAKAERIAESLQLALFFRLDCPSAPGRVQASADARGVPEENIP